MKKLYRRLNKLPLVNIILRNLILFLVKKVSECAKKAMLYWPVSGVLKVKILGENIILLAKGDDALTSKLFYGFQWEYSELQLAASFLRNSKVFLDVGGNIGLYSLLAAKLNPKIRVFCFEPNPINYYRIKKNVQLNDLSKSIQIIYKAVSSKQQTLKFFVPQGDRISDVSSVYPDHTNSFNDFGVTEMTVECIPLDAYCKSSNIVPDFIKVDVELHEYDVLLGAESILQNIRPVMLIELFNDEVKRKVNPKLDKALKKGLSQKIEGLFKHHGYSFYIVTRTGILRVNDIRSNIDNSMYLVTPKVLSRNFYVPNEYNDVAIELVDND